MAAGNRHFLGLDLGSSYTKFVVVDAEEAVVLTEVIPTLSRYREQFEATLRTISGRYAIQRTCTTGYGRHSYQGDLQKTELICAAAGVSHFHPQHKNILDIGGEDIKIIECGPRGEVLGFHMNDKCSAGTGAFITEIAEKAELEIREMSTLARAAASQRVINSFCTVFAKSEILGWKFEGVPIEDIAQGIYLSIVDRICKLPLKHALPVYLCGGVIAWHPYLQELLAQQLGLQVLVVTRPLYAVATGAALLARKGGSA